LAALHVFAAIFDFGFEFGEALALRSHRGEVVGRDAVRKAERAKARLPVGERGSVLFFGNLEASLGRGEGFGDFAVLAFDRDQALELGQVSFGMLQAKSNGAAAEIQFVVEFCLLGLGSFDFFEQ
jgi:hypothetical protein